MAPKREPSITGDFPDFGQPSSPRLYRFFPIHSPEIWSSDSRRTGTALSRTLPHRGRPLALGGSSEQQRTEDSRAMMGRGQAGNWAGQRSRDLGARSGLRGVICHLRTPTPRPLLTVQRAWEKTALEWGRNITTEISSLCQIFKEQAERNRVRKQISSRDWTSQGRGSNERVFPS